MTTVSLHELLTIRDESIKVHPPRLAMIMRRMRRIGLAPVRRALVLLITLLNTHGLVLSGCVAFVIAAYTLSTTLAWVTAGAALFFLEARRR